MNPAVNDLINKYAFRYIYLSKAKILILNANKQINRLMIII